MGAMEDAQQPVWWSWPSLRHGQEEEVCGHQGDAADEQLHSWAAALTTEDGQLVISSDALRFLPRQITYEMLGPILLAAMERRAAAEPAVACSVKASLALRGAAGTLSRGDGAAASAVAGLQLSCIDLQEPVARPLAACLAAYPLQRLTLHELNVDVVAAAELGAAISSGGRGGAKGSALRVLAMDSVFACDLAWKALCRGLAQGCELESLRLVNCLTCDTLGSVVSALRGAKRLQELDLSGSSLFAASSSAADAAWASAFESLASGCTTLRSLSLASSSLGPAAAAALAKLLATPDTALQQLNVSCCSGIGTAALAQLTAAAAARSELKLLDLAGTGLADGALRALLSPPGSWIVRACPHLRILRLGGNHQLSSAAAVQLAKQLVGGSLSSLAVLSLAGCPAVGNHGISAIAAVLSNGRCNLRSLDVSGCEVEDAGASALARLLLRGAGGGGGSGGGGRRATSLWRGAADAAAGGGDQYTPLEELRLADNHITAPGIQALTSAVSWPGCSLRVLDVSFNWVGPKALQPLAAAAAAAAATVGEGARMLRVILECLPEYRRVEAAKAFAAAAAAAAEPGSPPVAAAAAPRISLSGQSTEPSGSPSASSPAGAGEEEHDEEQEDDGCDSCLSVAGSLPALSDSAPERLLPPRSALRRKASPEWTFNTLFSAGSGGLSRASSAIAAAVCVAEGGGAASESEDICRHFAESDLEEAAQEEGSDGEREGEARGGDGAMAEQGSDSGGSDGSEDAVTEFTSEDEGEGEGLQQGAELSAGSSSAFVSGRASGSSSGAAGEPSMLGGGGDGGSGAPVAALLGSGSSISALCDAPSAGEAAAAPDQLAAGDAPTPGLKTLRSMRRRIGGAAEASPPVSPARPREEPLPDATQPALQPQPPQLPAPPVPSRHQRIMGKGLLGVRSSCCFEDMHLKAFASSSMLDSCDGSSNGGSGEGTGAGRASRVSDDSQAVQDALPRVAG